MPLPRVQLVVLDRLEYCSNLRNLEPLVGNPNYHFVRGDITSVDLVSFLIASQASAPSILRFACAPHNHNTAIEPSLVPRASTPS